jgi:hypothetical protein
MEGLGMSIRPGAIAAALLLGGIGFGAAAQPAPPPLEQRLVQIVESFATRYRDRPNDMAGGALRPARAREICEAMKATRGAARGWTGTVERLDSTSAGNGILIVRVSALVTLKTWNVEFVDTQDRTLIPHGSPLFPVAAGLRRGQTISFDGEFRPHRDDCIREVSMTFAGAMEEPDFLFRFTAIRPVN